MFDNLSPQPKAPVEDIFADTEVGASVKSPSPVGNIPSAPSPQPVPLPSTSPPSPFTPPEPGNLPPFVTPTSAAVPPPPVLNQFTSEERLRSKKWLWILLIVVVLGGGGVGAYWWYTSQTSNKGAEVVDTNTPPPPPADNNTTINVNTPAQPPETRDYDGDGLSDQEEVQQGTAVDVADTDLDGLTDGEEVKFWHTNPLNPDTDGDGYLDREEIDNGYDPNNGVYGARLLQLPNQELNMGEINNIINDIDNSNVVDCGLAVSTNIKITENGTWIEPDASSKAAWECFADKLITCSPAKIVSRTPTIYDTGDSIFEIIKHENNDCYVAGPQHQYIDNTYTVNKNVICKFPDNSLVTMMNRFGDSTPSFAAAYQLMETFLKYTAKLTPTELGAVTCK